MTDIEYVDPDVDLMELAINVARDLNNEQLALLRDLIDNELEHRTRGLPMTYRRGLDLH